MEPKARVSISAWRKITTFYHLLNANQLPINTTKKLPPGLPCSPQKRSVGKSTSYTWPPGEMRKHLSVEGDARGIIQGVLKGQRWVSDGVCLIVLVPVPSSVILCCALTREKISSGLRMALRSLELVLLGGLFKMECYFFQIPEKDVGEKKNKGATI